MVGHASQAAQASQRPPTGGQREPASVRGKAKASTRPHGKGKRFAAQSDLLGCVLATVTAWGATALPPGDLVRVILTLPVILFVPGYLALQAAIGAAHARDRRRQALAAFGLSPALVALVALATALVPGGFMLTAIANAILVTCLLLAAGAIGRRIHAADRLAKQRILVPAAGTDAYPGYPPRTSTDATRGSRPGHGPGVPPAYGRQASPAGTTTTGTTAAATTTTGTMEMPTQDGQRGVQFIAIRPSGPAAQASSADAGDTNAGNRQP